MKKIKVLESAPYRKSLKAAAIDNFIITEYFTTAKFITLKSIFVWYWVQSIYLR